MNTLKNDNLIPATMAQFFTATVKFTKNEIAPEKTSIYACIPFLFDSLSREIFFSARKGRSYASTSGYGNVYPVLRAELNKTGFEELLDKKEVLLRELAPLFTSKGYQCVIEIEPHSNFQCITFTVKW